MTSAADKYTSSLRASYELICAVTGERGFSTTDRLWNVKEKKQYRKKYWDGENDTKLGLIFNYEGDFKKRLFLRAKHTGSWIITQGNTVNDTVLAAMYFHDFMCTL